MGKEGAHLLREGDAGSPRGRVIFATLSLREPWPRVVQLLLIKVPQRPARKGSCGSAKARLCQDPVAGSECAGSLLQRQSEGTQRPGPAARPANRRLFPKGLYWAFGGRRRAETRWRPTVDGRLGPGRPGVQARSLPAAAACVEGTPPPSREAAGNQLVIHGGDFGSISKDKTF